MANELKALGDYIRKAREAKGFTLRDFAMRIGRTPATVSQIENGLLKPKETLVSEIARQLGKSEDVLLGLTGQASTNLQNLIAKDPEYFVELIRKLDAASKDERLQVIRKVRDGKW